MELVFCSWSLCQGEGLQDKGPADGAVLKVWHTAVTHTGVSAGQQHPVHCCILTDHTISTPPLWPVLLLLQHWTLLHSAGLVVGFTGLGTLLWVRRPRCPRTVSWHEERLQEKVGMVFSLTLTAETILRLQWLYSISALSSGRFGNTRTLNGIQSPLILQIKISSLLRSRK